MHLPLSLETSEMMYVYERVRERMKTGTKPGGRPSPKLTPKVHDPHAVKDLCEHGGAGGVNQHLPQGLFDIDTA